MELIPIFCELAFIEKLVQSTDRKSTYESFRENKHFLKANGDLLNLIFSRSVLSVDISYSELEKSADPIHRFLLESYGSIRINFSDDSFKNSFDDKKEIKYISDLPSPIYLLSSFGYQRILDLGMFGIKYDSLNLSKIQAITSVQSFLLSKIIEENEFKGWHEIVDLGLPINSSVIIDRYILKNTRTNKQNIEKILNALLPQELHCTFHLTIIIQIFDKQDLEYYGSTEAAEVMLRKKIADIYDYILSLKKEYSVNLAVYALEPIHFHDREIITNYYWIHSGHSFDYYDKAGKVIKDTRISFSGMLSSTNSSSDTYTGMKLLLNKFSRLLKDKEPKWFNITFINRLLT